MKNPVVIIILLIITLAATGFGGYALLQKSPNQSPSPDNKPTISQNSPREAVEGENLRYIEYSANALENAQTQRRVLFFYANWCPTCRPADKNFSENINRIPSDITVIRINYNDTQTDVEEKALAEKYGITYQHTYVQIDQSGNEVTKWNGGQIEELLNNIR